MPSNAGSLRRQIGSALAVAAAILFAVSMAAAAGGFDGEADGGAALKTVGAHQSFIRVEDNDGGPVRKSLKIGLGKSVLIEFPRDIRDVMVSNPRAVDAVVLSANRVFLLSKGETGEANAFFFDTKGEQFATFEIFVERETAGLEALLKRIIAGGNIKVEFINQTVILTGSVKNPSDSVRASQVAKQFLTQTISTSSAQAQEGIAIAQTQQNQEKEPVINLLVVEAEEQVMLKVSVAEVQRSVLKQMGVNLGAVINAGNFSTTILTENALPLTAAAGLGTLPAFGISTDDNSGCVAGLMCAYNRGPASGSFGNSGATPGWSNGNDVVRSAIRALERQGLVRTLAEPNLTAVSGEPAKFLAGGEYPVPVVDTSGALSVTFKEFGVALAFTPIVLSEGRISLKIETEVSELTSQGSVTLSGFQIPALKKRQAKSTVELPSGGTLAMAGLISDDVRQNMDGLPGAKDIPILGTLFRSREFIKNESELVVIVTPYLVRPVARQQLATPVDGLAPATDMKANFLGHLNKVYGKGDGLPAGDLKGDYGFIVE